MADLGRHPFIARLAAIIDVGGFRLGAVGQSGQNEKKLRVVVLRDQPRDANNRHCQLADIRPQIDAELPASENALR
jgi:hypothetical protein